MPRKNPLPQREIEIGRRLKEARLSLRCPRTYLAQRVGVHRAVIVRLELGQMLLKYSLGQRLCNELNVSQAWLLKGVGFPKPRIPIADELNSKIKPNMPFSKAFDRFIWPRLGPRARRLLAVGRSVGIRTRFSHPVGLPKERVFQWLLLREIEAALAKVPPELHKQFWRMLSTAMDRFCETNKLERGRLRVLRPTNWPENRVTPPNIQQHVATSDMMQLGWTEKSSSSVLTDITLWRKTSAMTEMDLLRARLKKALQGVKKGDFAAAFHVPLPRLSEWLSGRVIPSGETALRLLTWVERLERKELTLGSATNTAKGRTQVRKSKAYEKANPDRKKR
jgi:transcriptional regulator with XRE-family HTH domain